MEIILHFAFFFKLSYMFFFIIIYEDQGDERRYVMNK